jgi:general secretion pathway protein A
MDSLPLDRESRSYLAQFGLREPPFSLSPNPRFVYESAVYSRTIGDVIDAVNRREGLVLVTGDIGTGKTMLCRALVRHFGRRVFLSVILDPLLSGDDLIEQILFDFGVTSSGDGGTVAAGRHERVLALQQFLASLISLNSHAVVVIDEAQHLGAGVLEEIRLLSNFETDELKLLQLVLVGPPELESMLARPELRQIDQRISRRCRLQPLADGEVGPYVERRMGAARAGAPQPAGPGAMSSSRPEFAPAAIKALSAASGGIPRVVNLIADRALELASDRGEDVVTRSMVVSAVRSLDVPMSRRRTAVHTFWPAAVVAATAAAYLLGAGTVWWLGAPAVSSRPPAADLAPAAAPASTTGRGPAANSEGQPVRADAMPSQTASQAPSKVEPLEIAEGIVVVVASFRNGPRAADVTSALEKRGLPSFARDERGWYVVYVGPFVTREEALAAQQELAGEFKDSVIRVLQE